jgi:hypothetical protein
MSDPRRDEAESDLADIRAAQERLIDRVTVPGWYWWAVAALAVALGLVVDRGNAVEVAVGAGLFALVVAGMTALVILGGGRVQVSGRLLGGAGAAWIVGFVDLVVLVSLAIGFAVRAAGVTYPATIAALVAAVGVAMGGPILTRRLRRTMLRQSAAR